MAILILAAVICGILGTIYNVGVARFKKIVADAKAAGEPVSLQDIQKMRPIIPAERNMAPLVLEHGGAIEQRARSERANLSRDRVPLFSSDGKTALGERLTADRLDASLTFLQANRRALEGLHQAAKRPEGKYPLELNSEGAFKNDHLFAHQSAVRALALEALVAANQNRADDAIKALMDALALDRAMEYEPTAMSGVARTACLAAAYETVGEVLALMGYPDDLLSKLQSELSEIEAHFSFRWALLTERAYIIHAWQVARDPDAVTTALFRFAALDHAELLSMMTEVCDASTLADVQFLRRTRELERRVDDRSWIYVTTKLIFPAIRRLVKTWGKVRAEGRATIAALAAERFRLKQQRWPADLNELVPKYLPSVLTDPFDGKPLRYVRDPTGIRIYSVDDDLHDDGGRFRGDDWREASTQPESMITLSPGIHPPLVPSTAPGPAGRPPFIKRGMYGPVIDSTDCGVRLLNPELRGRAPAVQEGPTD